MFIVYDLIFLLASIFYLPIYLFKKKLNSGFSRRLGILPKDLELERPIWIHAVSVGETMAVKGLIEQLRATHPTKKIVISTVTATGNKIANSIKKEGDFVTYLPLDLSCIVRKVLNQINPSIFIIAETEIWPNLISYLYRKNIPVIIVNGRISDKSFKGYLLIKFLLKSIFRRVSLFCVQTERDKDRLVKLGVLENKINITGNMKFDSSVIKLDSSKIEEYRQRLCLKPQDKLLVCGSTHPGEEEIILGSYKSLLIDFPNLKLLIAPRHPQRSKEVEKIASGFGFNGAFLSTAKGECKTCITTAVFILDTIGELIYYYSIADFVFVGGSLVKKGGHNILEPASQGKPILFGPYMFNFRDIADLFVRNQAAVVVDNQEELKKAIKDLLNNPIKITELTQRTKQIILNNQGATQRNLQCIIERGHSYANQSKAK